MLLIPRLVERSTKIIDVQLPNKPGTSHYRIQGHNTLDGAFTSPDNLFEVRVGDTYASPSLERDARGDIYSLNTNVTRAKFNLNDFSDPSNNIPLDKHQFYLVVQEYRITSGTWVTTSPITVVPPTPLSALRYAPISVQGSAPVDSTAAGGNIPGPDALTISLGGLIDRLSIYNYDSAETLFYAFGEGTPYVELPFGESKDYQELGAKLITVGTDAGGTISFSIVSAVDGD